MAFARPGDTKNAASILSALGEDIRLLPSGDATQAIVIRDRRVIETIYYADNGVDLILKMPESSALSQNDSFQYLGETFIVDRVEYDVKGWNILRTHAVG